MAKRKRHVDYFSQDNASDYEPEATKKPVARSLRKRRSAATTRTTTTTTKRSTDTPDSGDRCPEEEEEEEASSEKAYATPHSSSQHLISAPVRMRPPLLDWYSGVHDVRGMPWRKPFDPTLDADARAQRAYEVRQ
jgi:A/G-specific adenine glycosylase